MRRQRVARSSRASASAGRVSRSCVSRFSAWLRCPFKYSVWACTSRRLASSSGGVRRAASWARNLAAERAATIQNHSTKTHAAAGTTQGAKPRDRSCGQTNVEIRAKLSRPPKAAAAARPRPLPRSQRDARPGQSNHGATFRILRSRIHSQPAARSGPRNSNSQNPTGQGKFKPYLELRQINRLKSEPGAAKSASASD
jgi:hypothetical protein